MSTTIRYGRSGECRLALDDCTRLAAEREVHPPLRDPVAALREALAKPQGFPPLVAATVPGDQVVVAVDDGIPQLASVVRGALSALEDAGVSPENITVVWAPEVAGRKELERQLQETSGAAIRFELHDPDDEKAIAMVGVTGAGEPLRLNRTIAEADFVLPIVVSQVTPRTGSKIPKFAGLFPRFSNRETQRRFQAEKDDTPKQRAKRAKAIDEAGWLLGVGLTVSVVPGAEGAVAAVLAGDPAAVAQAADDQQREIWQREAAAPGDLVIAALAGDEREQTWDNLALAIRAAERVLLPGGAIAVCTELVEPPPEPLNRLREAVDFEEVARELARESGEGVDSARALAEALEHGPVYLRSGLPAELVESMGMTPIESDAELSRLAAGRDHCVIIEEAQRVVPKLAQKSARD